jgi:hypothetical protein
MKKSTQIKGHLPGVHACEARQVFRAFRDDPKSRRLALAHSMQSRQPNPCDNHNFLNDQPKET